MKTRRRLLLLAALVLAVLVLAFSGGWYWRRQAAIYGEIRVVEPFSYSVSPAVLGDEVYARAVLAVPWGQSLESAELELDAEPGVISPGVPVIDAQAAHWGKRYFEVSIPLLAYRTGELHPGRVRFFYRRELAKEPVPAAAAEMALPSLEVKPHAAPENGELPLAGELRRSEMTTHRAWLWVAIPVAAAVLLAGWALWRLLRRKAAEWTAPPTAWESALEELRELRGESRSGYPARCFARLSDIVRRYIERRFALPSTTTTTPEFMAAMREESSPLSPPQQRELGIFLAAADMVKFAKLEPDEKTVDDAIAEAETFVRNTVPAPADGKEAADV